MYLLSSANYHSHVKSGLSSLHWPPITGNHIWVLSPHLQGNECPPFHKKRLPKALETIADKGLKLWESCLWARLSLALLQLFKTSPVTKTYCRPHPIVLLLYQSPQQCSSTSTGKDTKRDRCIKQNTSLPRGQRKNESLMTDISHTM